ncbi:spore coat protein YsxE [Oceanobacillus oncorhynchi subsp. incaldanensis]|uniref:spore coat protein YsxE n=1 Tax=Oceanobacillus TaxID=182709 RepID=UPI0005AC4E6E|nr:spore coat protein YsxE [Oceanobacillus oncorhynchi]GIO17042.1 spore coat protein YsxE [Oceanobacillus oncorhynchi subsp. incaldanensis]
MNIWKKVLEAYHIYPVSIEKQTERVVKVFDGMQEYALKRSFLTEQTMENWQHVYRIAREKNVTEILPVYLTRDNAFFHKEENFYYYLTPWIDSPEVTDSAYNIERTLQTLAQIHKKTRQTSRIKSDRLKESFQGFSSFCKQSLDQLHARVTDYESRKYMSPFELLYCTHYKGVCHAVGLLQDKLYQIYGEEETEILWSSSLCHQRVDDTHSKGGYLINWESGGFEHPARDLSHYFRGLTGAYNQPEETIQQAFTVYQKTNHLTVKEMHLVSVYLLNPSFYLSVLKNYTDRRTKKSMVNQVKELQQQFRRLEFGMNWVEFIQETYESKEEQPD